MKPYWELKSQRKLRPTTAGAIIGGMSSSVRAARRPRNLPLMSTATPMPAVISTAIVAAVKTSWLRSDCWKSGLARVSL